MKNTCTFILTVFLLFSYSLKSKGQIPCNSVIMEAVYNGKSHDLIVSPEGKLFFAKTYNNEVEDSLLLEVHRLDNNGKVVWKKRYSMLPTVIGSVSLWSTSLKGYFLSNNQLVFHWFTEAGSGTEKLFQLVLDTVGTIQKSRFYPGLNGFGSDVLLIPNDGHGFFLTGNENFNGAIQPRIYQFDLNCNLVRVNQFYSSFQIVFPGSPGYIFNHAERFGSSIYFSARIRNINSQYDHDALIFRTDTNLIAKKAVAVFCPKDSGTNFPHQYYLGSCIAGPNRLFSFSARKHIFVTELDSNLTAKKAMVFDPQNQNPSGFGYSPTFYRHRLANGVGSIKIFSTTALVELSDSLQILNFQSIQMPQNSFSGELATHNTIAPTPFLLSYGYTEILHPNETGFGGIHLIKFFGKDSLPSCNSPQIPLPLVEPAKDSSISITASTIDLPVPAPLPAIWTSRNVPFCQIMGCEVPNFKIRGPISSCSDSVLLSLDSLPGQTVVWNNGATTHSVLVPVPGKYKVRAIGICASFSDSILVSRPEIPNVGTLPFEISVCPNDSTNLSVLEYSSLQYSWINTATEDTLSKVPNVWIYNRGMDTASVSILKLTISQSGCSETQLVKVLKIKPLHPILPTKIKTCRTDTTIRFTPFPGAYNWFWLNSDGDTLTDNPISITHSGRFQLVYQYKNCIERDTVEAVLGVMVAGEIGVKVNNQTLDTALVSFPVPVIFSVPMTARDIIWRCHGATNFSPGGVTNNFEATEPGLYFCEADYLLSNGCRALGKNQIVLVRKPEKSILPIQIPNLVLHQSQTINHTFNILYLEQFPENELTIYNRWGKEVFNASPYQNDWPPSDLEPGIYFYKLTAANQVFSGWVDVVK